jgi:Domain of unknown function (DUF4124)
MQRLVPFTLAALAVLTPLAALAAPAAAIVVAQTITTYRWVDAQGVVHYSDTPQPGAQVIQLQSAQTYHATPAPPPPPGPKAATTTTDPNSPYQSCGIAQPAAEASFFAPESVPVSVQLAPGLRPGDDLTVTVDGAELAAVAPGRYQVTAPERGAHTVNVAVHDPDGKQVCRASPVTFYVQQPSLLSPTSPARGH